MNTTLKDFALTVVQALRASTRNDDKPLSLINHFYHQPSGLHNEGVWHNCVMILVYIKLKMFEDAQKTAKSLVKLNFDFAEGLFRSKTQSQFWDHENQLSEHFQSKSYSENSSKRSITNSFAVFTFGNLSAIHPEFKGFHNDLVKKWYETFFDKEKKLWKPAKNEDSYYRVVDQAVALIGCSQVEETLGKEVKTELELATATAIKESFKYGNEFKTPLCYIGDRKATRFLWQEIWVVLALMGIDFGTSKRLLARLVEDYQNNDFEFLVQEVKDGEQAADDENSQYVSYVGDNALVLLAIRLIEELEKSPIAGAKEDAFKKSLLAYLTKNLKRDEKPLLPVTFSSSSIAYWENTEFSLSCLLELSDFGVHHG